MARASRRVTTLTVLLVGLTCAALAQTGGPPDWTATMSKAKQFTLDGRHKDAIAVLEPVVNAYPKFADAHVWLGIAYEAMGREQAADGDRVGALKALDTAVLHMNHGFELGGGENPEIAIRGLVDLLGLLGRTEARKKTIATAVARYPGLPVVHWYAVQLAVEEGAAITDSLRTARAGIPGTEVSARLDYAGYLAALVNHAPTSAKGALITEVNALCDEAAKARPGDRRVNEEVSRIKKQLAIAATPVDATRGPAADEAGVTGVLRAIVSAQATYSAVCSVGFFASTLDVLGRPASGSSSGVLSADLVPAAGHSVLERYGYRIEMTTTPAPKSPASCNGVKAGGSASDFSVTARPLPGRSGRSLRIDQSGNVTAIQ